ncbi:rhomboid family intramembrane serine protease [Catellatospora sp. NPDC049111]|uniref:rhomboid family intramembrane serine protease n=1 Tax=Catellatospora sp. NPDC049111 TaxID=3155271 RepID=UPI0033E8B41F
MRPIPRVTAVVFLLTALPSLLQFACPPLLTGLRRDPALIADGQLWRLVTSSLVQDSGVPGTVSNLGFLLVLGWLTERTVGSGRWLLFFLCGVALGQVGGMVFDTVGAGSSLGLCGLAAGAAVAAWHGRDPLAAAVGALYALVVAAATPDTPWSYTAGPVVVAVLAGLLISRRNWVPRWTYTLVALVVGTGLTLVSDLHGPALLGGLAAGALAYRAPAGDVAALPAAQQ